MHHHCLVFAPIKRRHDTQLNDTQNNDTQNNDTQNNDTQNNGTQNDDTQNNDVQHNNKATFSIECHFAECCAFYIFMLNVVMLSAVWKNR
jgi:hypothetical protein